MSMCQIGSCTKDATQETEIPVNDSYTEIVLMCDEHMVQFKSAGQLSSNRELWRMS